MTASVLRFEDQEEWRRWQVEQHAVFNGEHIEIALLRESLTAKGMQGFCDICVAQRWFQCEGYPENSEISLRESLLCAVCGCNARQRASASVLFESMDAARSSVYLTEQSSPFYMQLKRRCNRLRGSEFTADWRQRLRLSLWLIRQGAPEWLRREDVTRLSFADRSHDGLVSLDVLEHVPDYQRALKEFVRVLRPGGSLVLTVPFYSDDADNLLLARMENNAISYLRPPEFHGDPLSVGVLCFHHFGWELLAQMRVAGFAKAQALRVRNPQAGIPESQWVLHAIR
jgi:SAM-dependent methyltransferase